METRQVISDAEREPHLKTAGRIASAVYGISDGAALQGVRQASDAVRARGTDATPTDWVVLARARSGGASPSQVEAFASIIVESPDTGTGPVRQSLTCDRAMLWQGAAPFRWKFASCFTLPRRIVNGEDVTPQLAQLRAVGANGLRLFLQHTFMDWDPPNGVFSNPWITPIGEVRRIVDYLGEQGFYVNLCALADCQEFGEDGGVKYPAFNQSLSHQIDRVAALIDALRDAPNVACFEIGNEVVFNGVDPWKIVDALGLQAKAKRPFPMSSGDYFLIDAIEAERPFRYLDILTDHPGRDDAWHGETGKTAFYINKGWAPDEHSKGFVGARDLVVISDEAWKAGESEWDGPDRANPNGDEFEDAFAGWAVGSSGATFHSVDGIRSRVLRPNQEAIARRAFAAMDHFPADAFLGTYTHDGYADFPLAPTSIDKALEVAGRICGNKAYLVGAGTQPSWQAIPRHGWRFVDRFGARDQIMILERA